MNEVRFRIGSVRSGRSSKLWRCGFRIRIHHQPPLWVCKHLSNLSSLLCERRQSRCMIPNYVWLGFTLNVISVSRNSSLLLFAAVLVSHGCCKKVPQTGYLKNKRNLFSCSSGLKSKIQASARLVLSGSSERKCAPCLSPNSWCCRQSLSFLTCRHTSLQPLPLSSHGVLPCVCISPLLIRTPVIRD